MQESLFEEDRKAEAFKKSIDTLMNKIRPLASDVKDHLKECEAYMRLLKDGPKTVFDIVYRCQNTELGAQTLALLAQQSQELGDLFKTAAEDLSVIVDYEKQVKELEDELGQVKVPAPEPDDAASVEETVLTADDFLEPDPDLLPL